MPTKRSRHIPKKVKDAVRLRDMDICQMCGRNSEYMEFDHITPFSLGAPATVETIQQLCRKCNLKKRNKTERKCSVCKGWNAHDAKFCHHCGADQKQYLAKTVASNSISDSVIDRILDIISDVFYFGLRVIGVFLLVIGVYLTYKMLTKR